MPADVVTMDKIVALCKRRGFIFPSSEIYGGLGTTYDYGHYGVLLKKNVKTAWWQAMLQERDDIVALDSAILQHPRDVGGERPPRAASPTRWSTARPAGQRFRADHLERACSAAAEAVQAPGRDARTATSPRRASST